MPQLNQAAAAENRASACAVMPLSQAAAMCVESAQLFALSLDGEPLCDGPDRAAHLLGVAEAHIISLVAIIRAMTS